MKKQSRLGRGNICLPGKREQEKRGQDKALGRATLKEAMEEGGPRRAQ